MKPLYEPTYLNPPKNSQFISYDKILVDIDSCTVTYEDSIVTLHPKEYKLLLLFLKYPNHVLSYQVIIDRVWEIDKCPTDNNIRSHIKGLRRAFKQVNAPEDVIETVHGLGYRLKPLKKNKSANPLISPSLSLMKEFLKAKSVEYMVINNNFIIRYISPGLPDYCDYPEFLEVGVKAEYAFPEFVGLEEVFNKLLNKEEKNFEVKGVARAANPNRPEYINFSIIVDDSKSEHKIKEENILFIFFEDASEKMKYKQRIVQIENELYLRLEVDTPNQ